MIIMSDDFKNSVNATEREMKGYVEVTYSSSKYKDNASVTNYPASLKIGADWVDINQIINNDRKGKNYASLEEDYFQLDGTFVLPNNEANKNPGMGYVSADTFKNDMEIPTTPFTLSTSLDVYENVNGLTLYFQNNKPLSLEIEVRSGDGSCVETFTEEDCTISENGIVTLTFSKRILLFVRICVKDVLYPNRRLRLQEIDFGLSMLYENEELISFNTIEQCNRFADEMPINECNVILGDLENKFDYFNPKGITGYLNDNVEIKPYVGVVTDGNGIEYCPLGVFWLESWRNSGTSQITLVGKDIFNKIQKDDYEIVNTYGTEFQSPVSPTVYLNRKSELWGLKINNNVKDENDYILGEKCKITDIYSTIKPQIVNLQRFSTLCGNTFTSNRYGGIRYISCRKHEILDKQITVNQLNNFQENEIQNPIKDITIKDYSIVNNNVENDFTIIFQQTLVCDGYVEFKYPLEKYDLINLTYTYIGDKAPEILYAYPQISTPTSASGCNCINIKFNFVGTITFTGKHRENSIVISNYDNVYSYEDTGISTTIDNDFLTNTVLGTYDKNITKEIADYRFKNQSKITSKFKYNGDPAIEVGDIIQVERKYSDENNEVKYDDVYVTKIESEFKGSFNQSIEGDIV